MFEEKVGREEGKEGGGGVEHAYIYIYIYIYICVCVCVCVCDTYSDTHMCICPIIRILTHMCICPMMLNVQVMTVEGLPPMVLVGLEVREGGREGGREGEAGYYPWCLWVWRGGKEGRREGGREGGREGEVACGWGLPPL